MGGGGRWRRIRVVGAALAGLALIDAGILVHEPDVVPLVGVDELVAKAACSHGCTLRVEGTLDPASFEHPAECAFRFRVEGGGETLAVRLHACVVSDPILEGLACGEAGLVVMEGVLAPDGVFDAEQLFSLSRGCHAGAPPRPCRR